MRIVRDPADFDAARRRRAGARRSRRSATTRCWSRSTSSTAGTSRCRCSPTRTATSCTSSSATAPPSAGTRRCSRRRRRRRSPPEVRTLVTESAVALARAGRLRQRRHRGVPARRRHRRGLLPGDEHPPPGRAPGHRAGCGSTRPLDLVQLQLRGRRRRAAAVHPGRRRACTGTRSRPGSTPRTPSTASCRRPAPRCGALARRRGGPVLAGRRTASGSTPRWRPGRSSRTAYDPMLGKVIAHGHDREAARRALVDGARRHRVPRADHQPGLPAGAGRERRVPRRDDRHRLARPRRRSREPSPDTAR